MSTTSAMIALALPGPRDWDFSDSPYGLEPLTLPHPCDDKGPPDNISQANVEDAYIKTLTNIKNGRITTEPATIATLERLFWFRWITGHQISFIIWRLLAGALRQVSVAEGDQSAASAAITQYVRGYCAMLLYTSSCTKKIYNETIRPSMYRQHTTFSGTWAPDYPPVRSLFHGRRVPPVVSSEVEHLVREIRLSQRIHLGVASKLVVGGRSLLQRSIANRRVGQPRTWGAIFDCYFVTLRAPVSANKIVAQLLRRQKAVIIDLATNGLYPGQTSSSEETPVELRVPAVVDCENDLANALFRIAGLAAGFPLHYVNKQLEA